MLDRPATTAQRLAGALISLASGMDENHTARLLEMGFEGIDIVEHIEEAKRIANRHFVRQVEPATLEYDRPSRLARAKALATGFIPDAGALTASLRKEDFSIAEIADFWPDLVAGMGARINLLAAVS